MKIQESAENYLETILVLKKKNGVVRSIDIANDLGVSKPSVSVAMKNLRNGEYIEMDKEGYITLLDKGREIAEKIYERHTFLTDWLTSIGVDPTVAAEDACRSCDRLGGRLPHRACDQRRDFHRYEKDIEDEIELTVNHCMLFESKNSQCDIAPGVLLLS